MRAFKMRVFIYICLFSVSNVDKRMYQDQDQNRKEKEKKEQNNIQALNSQRKKRNEYSTF